MIDAFSVLGGAPTDSNERLQELLEEKELLTDDASEAQAAYADLTNLKKRLRHEIEYFCRDDFHDFRQMVARAEKPTIAVIADILVGIGRWFEEENDELFEKINDARLVGGYPQIESENVIFAMIEEIKQECISSANSYLDGFVEDSVVKIFNKIVQIGDFESFFIDELMAHYELIVSETLQNKENECNAHFGEIESLSNNFNSGASLSPDLSSKVTEFEKALKDWDRYAQPLQKNAQARGGQHENSEKLVHGIRNRLVELCNVSQERLQNSLESFKTASIRARFGGNRYEAINARNILEKKLNDSISFIQALISLTQILSQVFAELEITVEQLKEDNTQLAQLKEVLINLRNQIPGAEQRASRAAEGAPMPSMPNAERNGFRTLLGILTAICAILMIVGFSIGNIAMGIAFIILGLAFGIGCGAFYNIKSNKKAIIAIILVPIILILAVVVPIACNTDSEKSDNNKVYDKGSTSTYTVTLNKDGGNGGSSSIQVKYNAEMPYATKPSKSGYEFMGYYMPRSVRIERDRIRIGRSITLHFFSLFFGLIRKPIQRSRESEKRAFV